MPEHGQLRNPRCPGKMALGKTVVFSCVLCVCTCRCVKCTRVNEFKRTEPAAFSLTVLTRKKLVLYSYFSGV